MVKINVSVASLASIMSGGKDDSEAVARDIFKSIDDIAHAHTPYGNIIDTLMLPLWTGDEYELWYVNPCAFIYMLCQESSGMATMFKQHIHGTAKLCVYTDECVPGNVLRPDKGRKVLNVYFTFEDLPGWFRAREYGWFLLCSCPASVLDDVEAGVSQLMRHLLKVFVCQTPGLCTTGMRVPLGDGSHFFMKCTLNSVCQDFLAFEHMFNLKGGSSKKPCFLCKNVMGRADVPEDHNYLICRDCTDIARFDEYDTQTFYDMCDLLEHGYNTLNQESYDKLGRACGLSYEPQGILWDRELRWLFDPINSCVLDWCHCICSSGGIAQYEVNALIRHMQDTKNINLEVLDEIAMNRHVPKRMRRCKADFFQTRVVNKPGSHLKCFANETVWAVKVCTFFAEMKGLSDDMPDHVRLSTWNT